MFNVLHTLFYNMVTNDNSFREHHLNQTEAMLEKDFRLWWETSNYEDIRDCGDPPLAGRFFNLWLIDSDLVTTPEEAAYFIRQMSRHERYAQRPDGLPYSRCLAHNERTILFRAAVERIQERENNA
jgi:hypothetical protein